MIEFDYNKIMNPNTFVHCDTEEKAINLLKWADSIGETWCSGTGQSYLKYNNWFVHEGETCYNLYIGIYDHYGNCKEKNYKILKYEDVFINKYPYYGIRVGYDNNNNIIVKFESLNTGMTLRTGEFGENWTEKRYRKSISYGTNEF